MRVCNIEENIEGLRLDKKDVYGAQQQILNISFTLTIIEIGVSNLFAKSSIESCNVK